MCSIIIPIEPTRKYTLGRAARYLGIHRTTLWRWVKAGHVPCYNNPINNRAYFLGKDIIAVITGEIKTD